MFNPGAIYAILLMALPLVDIAARSSTPYSILGVTGFSSQDEIDDAYNDLLQTLQDQNEKGLWAGDGDQEQLAKKKTEIHDAHLTITDPLERCYWHRDTGVRDWYGLPSLCWDEIVKEKLEALRDAIAQEDFSKLTWWPRSSKYSRSPAAQPHQEPEQATETSTKQELPVTTTKTPERKTSTVDTVTEPAARIPLMYISPKPKSKLSWISTLYDDSSRKLLTMAKMVTEKVWRTAVSTVSAMSYPVTILLPRFRTWLDTALPVIHSKASAVKQSVLATISLLGSYSQTALAQAKTWLAMLWAYICLAATAAWAYLTTCFKVVRKYLGPLAPSPSSDSFPTEGAPQPTIRPDAGFNADIIRSLDGEQETVLTKLTSLLPGSDVTDALLPSTTNTLRFKSQYGLYHSISVTESAQVTKPANV
ncbi:hypothetical protein QBC41DRAFT_219732 [Cercophora samala]|uniref:J domain-containing protein n=1 Tax=Cercophora samala TaxID=330535 RepID=A0AA39ZHV0_9PEZI|nr:hypothetical protein QBC41DRAFT_219732 [Cercophora samala]